MSSLAKRQKIIQDKRKQTPWRQFVKEIASWMPIAFYKRDGKVSRFPRTEREGALVSTQDYDPNEFVQLSPGNEDFFTVLKKLFRLQPKMTIQQWFENENCEYAEIYGGKNCYLSFGVGQGIENMAYTLCSYGNLSHIYNSFAIFDHCDTIFSSRIVSGSYKIFYSSNIHESNNIWFSSNLIGCFECLFCHGLQNVSYAINDIFYPKEEYFKKKNKILSSRNVFYKYYESILSLPLDNKLSENVSGGGIVQSQNIQNGYFIKRLSYGRNVMIGGNKHSLEHLYDCFDCGNDGDSNIYASHYTGESSSHVYCCSSIANSKNVYYSYYLQSCSCCLGCVGLHNKQFCIFNKQYTKEERHQKVDEIFGMMEKKGTLGDFFPASMNPFYFNDTAASLIEDFNKEEIINEGYLWREEKIKVDIADGIDIVNSEDLGIYETSGELNPEILKKVIRDDNGDLYRIIPMEYKFLKKHKLPLPRKHWLQRLKGHFRR